MERVPEQHGVVIPPLAGGEELHRRHAGVRRPDVQSPQNGAFGLLALLQSLIRGESKQTPNHHSKRCAVQSFNLNSGIHVRRRGERGAGGAAGLPQDCRAPQGQGARRGQSERPSGPLTAVSVQSGRRRASRSPTPVGAWPPSVGVDLLQQ